MEYKVKDKFEDEKLIHLIVEKKDIEASDILFWRYYKKLYSFLDRWLGRSSSYKQELLDNTIEVTLKEVWKNFEKFLKSKSKFKSWIFNRAKWRLIDELRKDRNKNINYISIDVIDSIVKVDFSPYELIVIEEIRTILNDSFDKIEYKLRDVITQSVLNNKSYEEIGTKYNCHKSTISRWISKGTKNLREKIRNIISQARFMKNYSELNMKDKKEVNKEILEYMRVLSNIENRLTPTMRRTFIKQYYDELKDKVVRSIKLCKLSFKDIHYEIIKEKSFGTYLMHLITDKNISFETLRKSLDISSERLMNILNDIESPTEEELKILSNHLKISTSQLKNGTKQIFIKNNDNIKKNRKVDKLRRILRKSIQNS